MSDVLDQAAARFERVSVEWNVGFGEWIAEVNQTKGYGPTSDAAVESAVRKLEKQRRDQECPR